MERRDRKAGEKGYYIFRTWMTVKGVKIYAKDYGLKAFKIWIPLNK